MAAFDVKAAVAQAKAKGPDMTQAQQGGGSFELPVEGFTRLRFIGYLETGKRESEWQGKKKVNDTAQLIFELSGPKHAPRETDSGKIPHRITVKCKLSMNEKSTFFQLFSAMNYESKATHIAELLGCDYIAEVKYNVKKYDGKERTFANLENIRKPFLPDPETGEDRRLVVDAPLSELRLFLWDFATPEMWDALFIEGEWEERKDDKGVVTSPAKSKNVIQNFIRTALNWKASPVYDYASGKFSKEDAAALDAAVGDVQQDADELDGIA